MSRRRLLYERRHGPRKTGEERVEWAERIHATHGLARDTQRKDLQSADESRKGEAIGGCGMTRAAGTSPSERGTTADRVADRPLPGCAQCGRTHDEMGHPLSLLPVTRHRSLLRPEFTHPLKSWYPVKVCSACVGPAVTEDEKRSPVAYQVRREKAS